MLSTRRLHTVMMDDTTADTTQGAIRRNGGQPSARKLAYLCRFCNISRSLETDVGGLWLRRARVRVPSVTLARCLVVQPDASICGDRKERLPGEFEDDHRDLPFGPLLVAGVALVNRRDLGPELGSLLFSGYAGDHGASEPAIVTRTSGLDRRFRYHAGCRSSPPNEATSTKRSPSTIGAERIVERSLPDLRPIVTSSMMGIPKALPKRRPLERLKIAR